jgi:nicotinamide riboside transporter PnuC
MKTVSTFLALLVGFSPIALFMCLFLWLRRSAEKHEPKRDGSALEFFVAPGMQILLTLVLVALVAFTVLVLAVLIHQSEGWYGVFIPLSILGAILLAKPRAVVLVDCSA